MKLSTPNKKKLIIAVVAVIAAGALAGRADKTAGLIISLVPIGFYLLTGVRSAVIYILNFGRTDNFQKIKLLTFAIITYIFVDAIFDHSIYYFLLSIVLAVDYIMYDNKDTYRNRL